MAYRSGALIQSGPTVSVCCLKFMFTREKMLIKQAILKINKNEVKFVWQAPLRKTTLLQKLEWEFETRFGIRSEKSDFGKSENLILIPYRTAEWKWNLASKARVQNRTSFRRRLKFTKARRMLQPWQHSVQNAVIFEVQKRIMVSRTIFGDALKQNILRNLYVKFLVQMYKFPVISDI